VFWVDSGNGSNGNKGTFDRPFATVNYAIGRCTANSGDQIHVKPGHTEAIIAAGSITCEVAGVTIIGHGFGADRPKFTWGTDTAATINQTAVDYRWVNCRFVSNILNVAEGFNIDASGFELWNCEVRDTSSILTFINFIGVADTCGRVKLIGNNMTGDGVTNDSFINLAGTHDDVVILDNYMAYSAIQTSTVALIVSTTTCTNIIIKYNDFATLSAAGKFIVLAGTANTGVVAYNSFQSDADQTAAEDAAGVDVTGCTAYENYFSSGADLRAVPTTVYTDEDFT
jgi:stress response protein SCP2